MGDLSNSTKQLTKAQFDDMIKRFNAFVMKNKREPLTIKITSSGSDYISLIRYRDMLLRYTNFYKANKRYPNYIVINPAAAEPTYDSDKTSYLKKFADAVGAKFNTFSVAYDLIKYHGYSYYYNDRYIQSQALTRLKYKHGLNCSDICQLMYQVAKDIGYSVRYVHIKCASGGGHIQLDVKGKEFGSKWKRVDPAAALNSGRELGYLWCADGKVLSYDDPWLISDDGN